MRVLLLVFVAMLGLSGGVWGWDPFETHEKVAEAVFKDSDIKKLMKKKYPTITSDDNQSYGDYWTDPDDWEGEPPNQEYQWVHLSNWSNFSDKYNPNSLNAISLDQDSKTYFWGRYDASQREKYKSYDFLRVLMHNAGDIAVPVNHSPAREIFGVPNYSTAQSVENGFDGNVYWSIEYSNDKILVNDNILIDNYKNFPTYSSYYDYVLNIHKNTVQNIAHRLRKYIISAYGSYLDSVDHWDWLWRIRDDGTQAQKFASESLDNSLKVGRFVVREYLRREVYNDWNTPQSYIDVTSQEVFKWVGSGEYTTDYTYVPDTEECPSGTIRTPSVRHQYTGYIGCKTTTYTPKSLKVRSFGVAEINKKDDQTMVLNDGDNLTVIANNKIIINSGFHAKRGSNVVIKTWNR